MIIASRAMTKLMSHPIPDRQPPTVDPIRERREPSAEAVS
jgi:hypothetical protein